MLVAYTEQNKPFILNSSIPQSTLHQLRNSQKFYCPLCKQRVLLKLGTFKIPHFSHYSKSNCENQFSERESEIHLKGKEQLDNLFNYLHLDSNLEPYLSNIKQRPDILVRGHNRKYAIEFQCSPISNDRLIERNRGYENDEILPVWILNTPKSIKKCGIQKISLSKNHQQFIESTKHHPYLMTYNPTVRQFFYISNLVYLHGNSYLSKVQTIPLLQQKFPFYVPKPISQNELKHFFGMYKRVKHNYLQTRVLLSRRGVKDVLLRSAYELGLDLMSLPNYIGIPLLGNEEFRVFSVDWQLAIFYFLHMNRIELEHMREQTIFYFLKWARLPQTRAAYDVVFNYCKLLEELSVKHFYRSIEEDKLLAGLHNQFLAI